MARALDLDLEPGVVKALALATAPEEVSARAGAWALEKDPEWVLVQGLETVQGRGQALHSGQVELRWARELDGRRTLRRRRLLLVRMQIGLQSAGLPVAAVLPEEEKKRKMELRAPISQALLRPRCCRTPSGWQPQSPPPSPPHRVGASSKPPP